MQQINTPFAPKKPEGLVDERFRHFSGENLSEEVVAAAEHLVLRVLLQNSPESLVREAMKGATDLIDLLHCVKDRDDDELYYLLRSIRNVVWVQRDLLEHALDRIDDSDT